MAWQASIVVTEGAEYGLWVGCEPSGQLTTDATRLADLDLVWETHRLPCCRSGQPATCDSGCWLEESYVDDDWAHKLATLRQAADRKEADLTKAQAHGKMEP